MKCIQTRPYLFRIRSKSYISEVCDVPHKTIIRKIRNANAGDGKHRAHSLDITRRTESRTRRPRPHTQSGARIYIMGVRVFSLKTATVLASWRNSLDMTAWNIDLLLYSRIRRRTVTAISESGLVLGTPPWRPAWNKPSSSTYFYFNFFIWNFLARFFVK